MKSRKVIRHYCDFCKKGSLRRDSMETHEKHCTKNPNRKCRMCDVAEQVQPELATLIAALPDPKKYERPSGIAGIEAGVCYDGFNKAFTLALGELRKLAGNCPACILSAIRQADMPAGICEGFDYKKEVESFWHDINSMREQY